MDDLAKYLKNASRSGKRILVTGHPHADPDAIGCILALEDALKQLGARVSIGVPASLSQLSKSVLSSIHRKVGIDPKLDVDAVVLVDTSSLDQLGELGERIREKKIDLVVIDHHRPSKGMQRLAKFHHVDERAASASELILELIRKLGVKLDPKTALVMLTGIISDTGQFRFATDDTFRAVNRLLEAGANYSRALRTMETPEDPSKRVAMLKAAQRAELHKAHGRHIVLSELSSFEADAASMFVKIGADVAIVGSEEEGKLVRISGRARSGVVSETNLHLGELMEKLAEEFDGTGGGHAGAAAMNVKTSLPNAKGKVLKALKRMLEPKSDKK